MRSARKETLVAFSRSIENHALHAADQPLIIAAIQHGRFFTGATRRHYLNLASTAPLVAIIGQHLPPIPPPARPVDIAPTDPLAREWIVVALGGHTASALIARETHNRHSCDLDRRFDFLVTHNRQLVAALAKNLMSRIP
ncbi:DICT sensory domain-containing protein [Mycobacterium simiae]|uniref:DICT sensory domain-containing protein n=1 Tax=Mycobacterium simiae TaxID=1784 RepID=UPI0033B1ADAB